MFAALEREQAAFLAHDGAFRSHEYEWERDALHEWSRCWEYPYALVQLLARAPGASPPSVLDVGSGVTFFPFVLAKEGWDVICVDNDPLVVRDVTAAARVLGVPKQVRAALSDGVAIPLGDASVDAAYSISVLEHVTDPIAVIEEIARVLKPGGTFVLTLDSDLKGDAAIAPEPFAELLRALDALFVRTLEERTVHPLRMLDTFGGPFPRERQRHVPGLMVRTATGTLLPLLGGPMAEELVHLTCYAGTFTRRADAGAPAL